MHMVIFFVSLEGSYALVLSENKSQKIGRLKCVFSINQIIIDKPTGDSFLPIMTKIANFFECKIHYKAANEITFLVQADSKHNLATTYLDKYPSMTRKRPYYLSFVKGLNYLGKRLTKQEINEIHEIQNTINNNRTYFN